MHGKIIWEVGQLAELDEPVVDLAGRDPSAAFGQPHRGMPVTAVVGPYLLQVLGASLQ